jgi:YVTN family beta-propeller protein
VVVDTTTDEIVGSIAVGRRPWAVALSPDGKTLYTANGLSDDVSVIDVASFKETGRIHVGSKPWDLVLVP